MRLADSPIPTAGIVEGVTGAWPTDGQKFVQKEGVMLSLVQALEEIL